VERGGGGGGEGEGEGTCSNHSWAAASPRCPLQQQVTPRRTRSSLVTVPTYDAKNGGPRAECVAIHSSAASISLVAAAATTVCVAPRSSAAYESPVAPAATMLAPAAIATPDTPRRTVRAIVVRGGGG